MSTRALYSFVDEHGSYHVYKHHDGYPSGALKAIAKALSVAWQLPRFEADEFAASFVAANKDQGGGVCLTMGKRWQDAIAPDCQYHYTIRMRDGELYVICDEVSGWGAKPRQSLLQAGSLAHMSAWSAKS